jgi:uncharacterized membrane protein
MATTFTFAKVRAHIKNNASPRILKVKQPRILKLRLASFGKAVDHVKTRLQPSMLPQADELSSSERRSTQHR